jgi:hypothetical protein
MTGEMTVEQGGNVQFIARPDLTAMSKSIFCLRSRVDWAGFVNERKVALLLTVVQLLPGLSLAVASYMLLADGLGREDRFRLAVLALHVLCSGTGVGFKPVKKSRRVEVVYLSRRSHPRRPFQSRLRFGQWAVRLGDRDFAVLTMDSVNIFMLMVIDGAYFPHGLLGQCMPTICFESIVLCRAKVFREDSISARIKYGYLL